MTRRIPWQASLAIALLAALLGGGCTLLGVKRQQELAAAACRVSGEVKLRAADEGPRVVVLIRRRADGSRGGDIVDHYSLPRDGRFYFVTSQPGRYALAAFLDRNANLVYDPDEPALADDDDATFTLAAGDSLADIVLTIDPDGRAPVDGPVDIRSLQARSAREQLATTLGQLSAVGEVADLSDPRFGAESGKLGLWRPYDFVFDVRPGIYLTEPYDPDRIPVLFVHGITGHPQEFDFLASRLDAKRFQAWYYFYPSGLALAGTVEHLTQLVVQLQAGLAFPRLVVLAHSMGGLVARGFVLHHFDLTGQRLVPLFVSLSTPWAGHEAAQKGVDRLPVTVDSWIDISPDSDYLRGLFYADPATRSEPRRLPAHVAYHLLFTYQRKSTLPGPSGDGVVTVASELRPEAQSEAGGVFGFDTTHTGILRLPEAAERLRAILAAAAR